MAFAFAVVGDVVGVTTAAVLSLTPAGMLVTLLGELPVMVVEDALSPVFR